MYDLAQFLPMAVAGRRQSPVADFRRSAVRITRADVPQQSQARPHDARRTGGVLGVLGAISRQMLPDNLVQWCID